MGSYSDCAVHILSLQENTLGVQFANHYGALLAAGCGGWQKPVRAGTPGPVTDKTGVSEAHPLFRGR